MARLMLSFALLLPCWAQAQDPSPSASDSPTQQELEDWFNAPLDPSAATVNEGELNFLPHPPAKHVHHHHNQLTIDDETVRDGWAELRQCHSDLDRVPATQIVFQADRIRDLRIERFSGMARAWVENGTVQMREIGKDARICVALRSKVLYKQPDGNLHIANGPFMRKFLDGYYPMHVSMEVRVKTRKLRFVDITPERQAGFLVQIGAQRVSYDAWFEGRLTTLLRFRPI